MRDEGRCQLQLLCNGEWLPFKLSTLEHVLPLCRGGTDSLDNLVLACGPCNQEGSKAYNIYGKIYGKLIVDEYFTTAL